MSPLTPSRIAGYKAIFRDVIGQFAQGLERDMEQGTTIGWERLMSYDSYSTRSFMTHVYVPTDDFLRLNPDVPIKPLPTNVVNWMEGLDKTTGWYDRAFTSTILEEMAFGFTMKEANPDVKFYCLEYVRLTTCFPLAPMN
jgi:hypothetical protein